MYIYSNSGINSKKPSFSSKMSQVPPSQVDAFHVGTHCQLKSCNRLDYLPWTCDRCKLKFCEDHRMYDAHQCAVAAPTPKIPAPTSQTTRPSMITSLSCYGKDCKTLLNTTTSPATRCVCGHLFCLKHRHPSDHACTGAPPKQSSFLKSASSTMTKEKLLLRLKEWSQARKTSEKEKSTGGGLFKGLIRTKSNQANSTVVQRGLEIGRLRQDAKGDNKIAEDKRIYVHGEGPPNLSAPLTNASQVLRKPVYFSKEWSNGKVLDRLADTLGVKNENNRTGDREKRLQLFHIESGTLLEMDKKFGDLVKNGDTIVIARGW